MRQQWPPGCLFLFWVTAIRSVQTSLFCQPGLLPSCKVQDEDHSPALWSMGHCCGNRYRGTQCKMFCRVISQLAKFPTFKTSTFPIALNAEAIGVAFQRGQNCSRCQQKAHRTKSVFFLLFFLRVFSPWSCLPISLWIHPPPTRAPWGALVSNHYLMTEICRQKTEKKRRRTVP